MKRRAQERDVQRFISAAELATEQGDKDNIDAVLQVSILANIELYGKIRRDRLMCDALRDLMKDVIEEEVEEGRKEGREEGRKEGRKIVMIECIKNVMKNLKVSAEQAMDVMGISGEEQSQYAKSL